MAALDDCDCGYSGALGESHAYRCPTVTKCRHCRQRLDLSVHTMTCPYGTGRAIDRGSPGERYGGGASRATITKPMRVMSENMAHRVVYSEGYRRLTSTITEIARHPPSCLCGIVSDDRSKHHTDCPKSRSG